MSTRVHPARPVGTRRVILLVCLAVFGLMTGQQMVNPVLPPLARELGFSELALGVVWTVGASGVVLASPFWARRSVAWGHRPVLVISLVGATAGLLGFAVVIRLGLGAVIPMGWVFGLILLSRGVLFGLAWAAAPVTALHFVSQQTSGSAERVRGMSLVGAAQGLGLAAGPALGGAFSLTGLVGPVNAAPVVVALVAVLVLIMLPKPAVKPDPSPPARVSAGDRRMWPYLVIGFVMYLGLTLVLMTIGFLLQDRLDLTGQATGRAAGLVMVTGAVMIIIVQAVVVPRLEWAPPRLIRVGAVVMTLGMAVVMLAPSGLAIGAGVGLLGAGMGFGVPGFTAAPTLLARAAEQGAVAGLLGTSSALALMLGPLLGTGLYTITPSAPYLVGVVLLGGLVLFAFLHPATRLAP